VQHDAIDDLTAGDRQRVALARTLAPHPSVLLLDEPLGTTDEAMKPLLRQELRSILTALDATAIVATRDVNDAASVADDLVVLDEGRVLQTGPIGVVLGEPASVRVADLVGYLTLAHGTVRRGRVEEPGVGAMAVPGLPATEAARIMAHPAALLAVPADSGLGSGVAGLVVRSRAFGPTWTVDLSVGGRLVEARWEWDLVAPRVGSRLAIAARPGTLRVFPSTLAEIAGAIPRAAPSAPVPATATPASATPAMPTASDALVEAIAADLAPEPPTAPTPPVAPTAPAPHLEPPASAMPPAARTQQPLPPMPAPPSSAVPPPAAPPAPPAEAPPAPPIDVAPLTPAEHRAAEPPSRRAKSRCSGRRDRCPRSPLRHPRPRPCRRHVAVCARPCPRPSEVSSDTDRCRCTSVRSRCSATPSTGRKRRE
jgi:hypothetical protein